MAASKFTIKEILSDNWSEFLRNHKAIRDVVKTEVNKMINCGELNGGFAQYKCPHCGKFRLVPFRCHSRFCNTCGSAYQADRAANIAHKLIKCRHRHIVFTTAEELRWYFRKDRTLLNVLFETAAQVVLTWSHGLNKKEKYTPGIVAGLHTFGRDLKWNPHIHMLVSEGCVGKRTPWKPFHYFPYIMLRKSWMTALLANMKKALNPAIFSRKEILGFKKLVDELYVNYKDGFYVNAPAKAFNDPKAVANYITRYIGRPAMAQSRITNYDEDNVSFWYNDHATNKRIDKTVTADEFIQSLIIHIPDKWFNMLRYYGIYAKPDAESAHLVRMKSKQQLEYYKRNLRRWEVRIELSFNRRPLDCSCGHKMELFYIHDPRALKKYRYIREPILMLECLA